MIIPLIITNGKLNSICGISLAKIISFSLIGSDFKIHKVFDSSEKLGLDMVTIPVLIPRPMQMNTPIKSVPNILVKLLRLSPPNIRYMHMSGMNKTPTPAFSIYVGDPMNIAHSLLIKADLIPFTLTFFS